MSTLVTDVVSGLDEFSVSIVGYCNGKYTWDLDDPDVKYQPVVDVYIDTVVDAEMTALVIEYKEKKNGA